MQNAQKYLEIIRSRGERRLELQRVYRNLHNRDLFLLAYAKLYANKGATTPGTDPNDTVDGMSLKKIESIIADLEAGKYQWKPVRRTYIPKKNGKLRPLGMPNWSDKLLQQVINMVLTNYYEPQFSDSSHGFRPGRSCHTALRSILYNWKGTKWFIEGDIKGCFDNIDHSILLEIIGRNIRDERLLKLLREMLEAGYLEDWQYHQTYSGTPQGGIVSPLLANIFLNELDQFVEEELAPQYTKGERRKNNPEYARLTREIRAAKEKGDIETYETLKRERGCLPYGMPDDPDYRRLKYVRYADDFLIGFVGPKSEAEQIKEKIGEFLSSIKLMMSQEKTLITHATDATARFLGYEVTMAKNDNQKRDGRRSINGAPLLIVPDDVVNKWKMRYMRGGKPFHRTELINNSDYDIVTSYNMEFQGLVNYYTMAYDVSLKLYTVKYMYLQSLVKTLAVKHKKKATWVYRNYYRQAKTGIKSIVITVEKENGKKLVAMFGAKPIRFCKGTNNVSDTLTRLMPTRNELLTRLLANRCELCGSQDNVETHHIRKLADLKARNKGRGSQPLWVIRMVELRRKTLIVCEKCHKAIHGGTYNGPRLI